MSLKTNVTQFGLDKFNITDVKLRMQVFNGWMALTLVTVKFNAEVIFKSCGKHDKHFTNVCNTCSEDSSFLQRQN